MSNWFPEIVSTYGGAIDQVFFLIFWIGLFWFVLAEGLIFYCIFRYRRKDGRKASFIPGERWKQLAWILIPAAIVLLLDLAIDFAGAHAYDKVKGELPPADVTVRVIGKQFNWEFVYPGPDGAFDTPDDLSFDNELHVPVDRVVHLMLRSNDVIHSFFVPVLRLKQDIVPGREIPAWFEATKAGEFEIACAELCGYGHYTMRGFLTVHAAADYDTWVREQWPAVTMEIE
jgi:cytochrome c oxidase subunit 2